MKALETILALGIIHVVSAIITEQDLCAIFPDKVSFPQLGSCKSYFTCIDGKPKLNTCLGDLFFDKETGKCDDRSKVTCEADLDSKCIEHSIYLADPESCQHYYICINGRAKQVACPQGLVFNPNTTSCVDKEDYECPTEKTYDICKAVPSHILFKHNEDCKKYRMCSSDRMVERSCPGSLWFNAKTGQCDVESIAKCVDPEPIIDPLRPENEETCGTPSKPFVGLRWDKSSCRGYFRCNYKKDSRGNQILDTQPEYLKCGKNEIFDVKANSCALRQNKKCSFDRCDGWGNEYINIEGDGCRGYIVCENNKEVMRMKCPDKHFFDELKQDCVKSPVQYASCQLKEK